MFPLRDADARNPRRGPIAAPFSCAWRASAAQVRRRSGLVRTSRAGAARPEEGAAAEVKLDHRVADRPDLPELTVAQGESASPAALVERAIRDMGGMARFVSRGDTVVVKPNIRVGSAARARGDHEIPRSWRRSSGCAWRPAQAPSS